MIKLAETDFVTVTHSEELYLVSVLWKPKALSFNDYKFAFETALDYQLKCKTPIFNYISDVRDQTVVSPAYRKWFQDEAVPRASRQGLHRGAVITDAGVFKRYYLNHIMDTTKRFGLPLKLFKEPENAFRWFRAELSNDLKIFESQKVSI